MQTQRRKPHPSVYFQLGEMGALGRLDGLTFRQASRTGTYRDHPAGDGTARYDDVWGG